MATTANPRKISKRGNSDHVSIPQDIMAEAGLERGDRAMWVLEDDDLKLEKVEWRRAGDE